MTTVPSRASAATIGVNSLTLVGKVGEKASCGIYEWRPSPCREFAAGSDACNRVRLRHGMQALETGLL